jgi:hypothetical protein
MTETLRRQDAPLELTIVDAPDIAPVLLSRGESITIGCGNDCGL